jgi:uncharacterized cupredoxin-like copper-binding protein
MDSFYRRLRGVGRVRTSAAAMIALVAFGVLWFGSAYVGAQQATPTAPATACPADATTGSPAALASPAAGTLCVTIELGDLYFDPNVVTIPADTPVTFTLENHGAVGHNFSITDHKNPSVKDLGIDMDFDPGQTKTVAINAPAGTYYFYCDVPGHEQAGMFGYLIVQEGAAIATQEATVTPPAS